MATARTAVLLPLLLRASLAAAPLLAACGAADIPAAPPAASCPPVPRASATAVASASPVPATPDLAPTVVPLPVDAGGERLSWAETYDGGDVLIEPDGEDAVVVPQFLGAVVEGTRVAVLDAAGLPRWESSFPGVGAIAAAVAPGGAVVAIAVDPLDWPKTSEAYDQSRVVVIEGRGKRTRSWRISPAVTLTGLRVDKDGQGIVTGTFVGTVKLSGGVTLAGTKEVRSFVARTDLQGKVLWARDFELPVTAHTAAGGAVVVHEAPEDIAKSTAHLHLLSADGKPVWRTDAPARCVIDSVAAGLPGVVHVTATAPCFGGTAPATKEESVSRDGLCELATLDAQTGKVQKTRLVPGCRMRADEHGFVVVRGEDFFVTAMDPAGKELWSLAPRRSGCMMFAWGDFAITPGSVYLVGRCEGERIGTMFNSPYSRASDRSTTYLVRYARK